MPNRQSGLVVNVDHDSSRVGSEVIRIKITHGTKEKGKMFIPLNETQRSALETFHRQFPGHNAGLATVTLAHNNKTIIWRHFFPISIDIRLPIPQKIGIGPLVHYAIIEYLARKRSLEGYEVLHDQQASKERIRQLRLMGIDHRKAHSFPEYREIVKRAVTARFGREPELHLP